jgi:cystathionine beta-lyase/cystathionine gamma-synthase
VAQSNRYRPGREHTSRTYPVVPPIYQTTTFELDDLAYEDIQGTGGLHETWYSRFGNPTVAAAAADIARLHEAQQTLMAASGMAAIATTLLTLLSAGDALVASRQVYGDTGDLIERDLPRLGVTVVRIDAFDTDGWRQAIANHRPAVVYGETLSNPQLRLMDIPAVAGAARAVGAAVVIDNTFATPHCTRPLELGADAVVDSVTKFLAGHSDVVAGAVSTNDPALHEEIQRRMITLGGCLDPHAAFLVWRGLRTFRVRLMDACRTAEKLADAIAQEVGVSQVIYPGQRDHPDAQGLSWNEVAKQVDMTVSGAWSRYRKARPPKPPRLGRWQRVLADATKTLRLAYDRPSLGAQL